MSAPFDNYMAQTFFDELRKKVAVGRLEASARRVTTRFTIGEIGIRTYGRSFGPTTFSNV
jgi:hypothetical protein